MLSFREKLEETKQEARKISFFLRSPFNNDARQVATKERVNLTASLEFALLCESAASPRRGVRTFFKIVILCALLHRLEDQ